MGYRRNTNSASKRAGLIDKTLTLQGRNGFRLQRHALVGPTLGVVLERLERALVATAMIQGQEAITSTRESK